MIIQCRELFLTFYDIHRLYIVSTHDSYIPRIFGIMIVKCLIVSPVLYAAFSQERDDLI